jgi:hypothetical protein
MYHMSFNSKMELGRWLVLFARADCKRRGRVFTDRQARHLIMEWLGYVYEREERGKRWHYHRMRRVLLYAGKRLGLIGAAGGGVAA